MVKYFNQSSIVAIEAKMAPGYAYLFMGFLEAQLWETYIDRLTEFCKSYIDVSIGVTSKPKK